MNKETNNKQSSTRESKARRNLQGWRVNDNNVT